MALNRGHFPTGCVENEWKGILPDFDPGCGVMARMPARGKTAKF
jgi:hypothetical protein